MAKGDYYFPLYYRRLLSSTIGWKDDEFGCYMRLLIHQFDNGSIPADLNELSRIAPSVKKHWPLISKKFHQDENGNLINDVMNDVVEKVQDKKQTNKKNSLIAVERRKQKQTEHQTVNQSSTERSTERLPILITNNQESITNNQKELVVGNGELNPPSASTTTPDFLQRRKDKLYEFFFRASGWPPELIVEQINLFENKYGNVPVQQCGALINKWVGNYKPSEEKSSGGNTYSFI